MKRSLVFAAAVLMLSLAGCSGDDPSQGKVSLSVYLKAGVTAEQRSAVEQRLRTTSYLEGVTFESREQAYANFKERFKDEPDMWQQIKPEEMPESFTTVVTDGSLAEAVEIMLGTRAGVSNATINGAASQDPEVKTIGVILRLSESVTSEQRDAITNAVRALPQAESIRTESRDDAFERLKKRCDGKADLTAALDPAKTHASVRFTMRLEKSPGFTGLRQLAGVTSMHLVPVSTL